MLSHSDSISTTVEIPVELLERAQRFIETGFFPNTQSLILIALEQFVEDLEEQESELDYEDFDDQDWDDEDFVEYDDMD